VLRLSGGVAPGYITGALSGRMAACGGSPFRGRCPRLRCPRPFRAHSVGWNVDKRRSARAFKFIPFRDRGGAISALNTAVHELAIEIGAMPILVRTDSADFAHMLEDRYGKFVTADAPAAVMELEIELIPPGRVCDAEDVTVRRDAGRWVMERGDFRAEWDPQCRRGWVRQSANPYAIDGVLRILHSLILAREGGFLVHAASAVRNGRAFLFSGVSGAGKTTISRLAPPDVVLLTDEISYVRRKDREQGTGNREQGIGNREERIGNREGRNLCPPSPEPCAPLFPVTSSRSSVPSSLSPVPSSLFPVPSSLFPVPSSLFPAFEAFGTPFAGELARVGENLRAPLAALYLLAQGPENRIEPMTEAEAARELLQNILFFARDEELVRMIFQTVCDFVRRVPVRRLVFTPDARVWELIT